jgi:hypothetical protein
MSDTPETDALYMDDHRPNLMDHARRLERERDELRRLWEAECAESRKLEQAREYNAGLVAELKATLSELRQVIRDFDWAFPDLAEFQDKNGRSLKWLAEKIQNAKGEA